MNTSLRNLTALSVIFASLCLGFITLDDYLTAYNNQQATQKILHAMVQECQAIKAHQGLNDTFSQTSLAVNQVLGKTPQVLSQESYLELLSRCAITPKEKI